MRFFVGPAIPGLVEASNRLLNQMVRDVAERERKAGVPYRRPRVEFEDWAAAVRGAGFTDPRTRDHLEWMVVNDPRVVRNGKPIRRYTGPVDEEVSA